VQNINSNLQFQFQISNYLSLQNFLNQLQLLRREILQTFKKGDTAPRLQFTALKIESTYVSKKEKKKAKKEREIYKRN
jgi:hypothetical protein